MDTKLIEFRPNQSYLNPDFDGYKLSLNKIPTDRRNLNASVDQVFPSENQFAFIYAKLFSLHNYLVGESFDEHSFVYFVDENCHIQKVSDLLNIEEVWTVPLTKHRKAGDYYFSLKLVSPKLAVLSDGTGSFFILNTNPRKNSNNVKWECMFSEEILGFEKPFVIQDAILCNDKLHCLLFSIEPSEINKHSAILNVITLSCAEDGLWCVLALRELQCQGDIHYAALEKSGKAIYSISDVCLKFTADSENPIVTKITQFINNLQYEWLQTDDSVTLQFLIEHELNQDISVTTTKCNIIIEHKNVLLLEKDLYNDIKTNVTTWTINKNVLEISLFKEYTGVTWPQVFKDDSLKYIEDPNIKLNESKGPSFSKQQVEECDIDDDDNSSIFERICLSSHHVTHRAIVGCRHVLLTTNINVEMPPAVAIRYDVDACLWQPMEIDDCFYLQHVGTLPAFGYVQASKQQKKFSVCAADLSYSAISESNRHLFIYKHETTIDSDLKNRKTGKYVNSVSQQHVVTLPHEILGIYAANKNLFLLFKDSISVLHL